MNTGRNEESTQPLLEPLTRREEEVLELLAEGLTSGEMAERLTLAVSSVRWYVQQIYGKLGVNGKRQAIARAGELGLLRSGPSDQAGIPVPTISAPRAEPALPTGTVTFLFTDIEGSTPLWESQPQQMTAAIQVHNTALRQAIESNGGVVFKTVGDAFQAAFGTAPQALKAAIEGQRALQMATWNELGPLKVRMGLHTGEAVLDPGGDEYAVSHAKNRVARITSAAHGGQVLLSLATYELLRDHLLPEVSFKDLGGHRLKGLLQPERIFQVENPELPHAFPPLKSETFPQHNLPLQLSSFIGRDADISQLRNLIAAYRLVTLVGIGGVGKTRLELKVAEEKLEDFPEGVWLVNLAIQAEPRSVPQVVGKVFGLREQTGALYQDELINYLHAKRLLLVLDNCEHLVEACASLSNAILRTCPGIHILASSREALGVEGEKIFSVPSLSVPMSSHNYEVATLAQYDAVKLFVERACTDQDSFRLTHENAQSVAQICIQLDGIPLALELAAARVKTMGVAQIASRLDNCFRVLGFGSRTAEPRHQTLRATIDWSYDLLSEPECILFRRLCVFKGGWTVEAAEGICADRWLLSENILDTLSQLVTKSLVIVELNDRGLNRYQFLETVRQYAQEKLAESGDLEKTRQSHFNYFLNTAEHNEGELKSGEPLKAFAWLAIEHSNLLAALEWASAGDSPRDKAGFERLTVLMHQDFHGWGSHILNRKALEGKH